MQVDAVGAPVLNLFSRLNAWPLSTQEALKLLASFDRASFHGLRNYTLVSLLWALGLRTSELTGLKVKDFEIGHGKRIGLLRICGKNKKQRALFVVDRLFDQLLIYLSHPNAPKHLSSPMFLADTKKTAISNNRVQRLVKDQARKVGLNSEVTPRVLRHSFATEMYHQKVPLSAIQAMMGHDTTADTSVYIHVSEKLQQLALVHIRIAGGCL